jgi:hypothetical protein
LFENVDGKGAFEDHLSTLARINEGIYKREFISASQAWRQKWIVKPAPIEVEEEEGTPFYDKVNDDAEETANAVDEIFELNAQQENEIWAAIIDSNPGTISMLPNGSTIAESGVTDFRQVLEGTKDDIRFLGEETATQFSMAVNEAVNMSASGADAIRERGDKKALTLQYYVSPQIEMVMALSFAVQGDAQRADPAEITVVWRDVREVSILDKASAFKQMVEAGLSKRMSMRIGMQMTPTQILEEEQAVLNEEFVKALSTVPEVTTTQGAVVNAAQADQIAGGPTSGLP